MNEDAEATADVMQVMAAGMGIAGWPQGNTYVTEVNSFTVHTPDGRALAITVEDVTG